MLTGVGRYSQRRCNSVYRRVQGRLYRQRRLVRGYIKGVDDTGEEEREENVEKEGKKMVDNEEEEEEKKMVKKKRE